jgi:hypothetical protein
MYKLIDTTYKYKDQLDINNKYIEDKANITTFLEAVFSKTATLISTEDKAKFEVIFKEQFKTKLQTSKPVIPDSKQQIIVVSICFDFLIELNRLIHELNYIGFINVRKAMSGVLANNILTKVASKVIGASYTFFGSPQETYNILIREYTMMTGNFGMISTRYTLHYNELTNAQKEIVSNEVGVILKKVETSLSSLKGDLQQSATEMTAISDQLTEGQPEDGDNSIQLDTNVAGGKQKHFKKNKYSKKLQIKRN